MHSVLFQTTYKLDEFVLSITGNFSLGIVIKKQNQVKSPSLHLRNVSKEEIGISDQNKRKTQTTVMK